jgi:hypothetical protein
LLSDRGLDGDVSAPPSEDRILNTITQEDRFVQATPYYSMKGPGWVFRNTKCSSQEIHAMNHKPSTPGFRPGKITLYANAKLVSIQNPHEKRHPKAKPPSKSPRKKVGKLNPRIRNHFLNRVCKIDRKLCPAHEVLLVTLSYPRENRPKNQIAADIKNFYRNLESRYKIKIGIMGVIEFASGRPHLHMLLRVPGKSGLRRSEQEALQQEIFRVWMDILSKTQDVVDHDLAHAQVAETYDDIQEYGEYMFKGAYREQQPGNTHLLPPEDFDGRRTFQHHARELFPTTPVEIPLDSSCGYLIEQKVRSKCPVSHPLYELITTHHRINVEEVLQELGYSWEQLYELQKSESLFPEHWYGIPVKPQTSSPVRALSIVSPNPTGPDETDSDEEILSWEALPDNTESPGWEIEPWEINPWGMYMTEYQVSREIVHTEGDGSTPQGTVISAYPGHRE